MRILTVSEAAVASPDVLLEVHLLTVFNQLADS